MIGQVQELVFYHCFLYDFSFLHLCMISRSGKPRSQKLTLWVNRAKYRTIAWSCLLIVPEKTTFVHKKKTLSEYDSMVFKF